MARRRTTRDGHNFDEATSALQKTIRRGDVDKAIYFGLEMFEYFPWYTFRRLGVMATEDIGLADTLVVERVLSRSTTFVNLAKAAKNQRVARPDLRPVVALAIREMALASKSREADHLAGRVIRGLYTGELSYGPENDYLSLRDDFAEQCRDGQEVDATVTFFQLVHRHARLIWIDLPSLAAALTGDSHIVSIATNLATICVDLQEKKGGYEPHTGAFMALLLSRSDNDFSFLERLRSIEEIGPIAVPDYALDMHTQAGRRMRRGYEHFAAVGSKIANEGYEDAYVDWSYVPEVDDDWDDDRDPYWTGVDGENSLKMAAELDPEPKAENKQGRLF